MHVLIWIFECQIIYVIAIDFYYALLYFNLSIYSYTICLL